MISPVNKSKKTYQSHSVEENPRLHRDGPGMSVVGLVSKAEGFVGFGDDETIS